MDFANILFGGPCNRFCPFCIGRTLPRRVQESNLGIYPLHNQDQFVEMVNQHRINQVVLTGTTTDPQLYQHEEKLVSQLRQTLHPQVTLSLHTNGVLALKKRRELALYDKVCLSLPSFNPLTYGRLMGVAKPPDVQALAELLGARLKISCVVAEENREEIPQFLARCQALGIGRVVLRYLVGCQQRWPLFGEQQPGLFYKGQPVYQVGGMEVTVWEFERCQSTSLNLFADGTIGCSYLLQQTAGFETT